MNNSKYEIISVIGEGSYGIVYKCKAKETKEIVAIKKFKDNSDHSINKSMLRELKSLKIFNHKNIINYRESFKKDGNYFFVFDYVDKNLLEFISLHPKGVEANLMKKILYQICCGLRQMHKMRFAHRDIKPENILIDAQFNIKICDFGFARLMTKNSDSQEGLTEYVATRWYRAPELLMGVNNYGMEIDFWSVGCIMGELIDGNPVFPGDSDLEQLYMIRKMCGNDKINFDANKEINNSVIKNAKNKKEAEEKIEKTKYVNPVNGTEILVNTSLETRYAGKVSRDALSLMKRLLDPNPLTRIKSEEIFKHEYFADSEEIIKEENEKDQIKENKFNANFKKNNSKEENFNKKSINMLSPLNKNNVTLNNNYYNRLKEIDSNVKNSNIFSIKNKSENDCNIAYSTSVDKTFETEEINSKNILIDKTKIENNKNNKSNNMKNIYVNITQNNQDEAEINLSKNINNLNHKQKNLYKENYWNNFTAAKSKNDEFCYKNQNENSKNKNLFVEYTNYISTNPYSNNMNNVLINNNNGYVASICSGDLTTNPNSPAEYMVESYENKLNSKLIKKQKRQIIQKNFNNSILFSNSKANNNMKSINAKYANADKDYFMTHIVPEEFLTSENLSNINTNGYLNNLTKSGLDKRNNNTKNDKNNHLKLIHNTCHNLNVIEKNKTKNYNFKSNNEYKYINMNNYLAADNLSLNNQYKNDDHIENMKIIYNNNNDNNNNSIIKKENQYVMKGRNYKKHQFSKSLDKKITKFNGLKNNESLSENSNDAETKFSKEEFASSKNNVNNKSNKEIHKNINLTNTKILIVNNNETDTNQISTFIKKDNLKNQNYYVTQNSENNLKRNFHLSQNFISKETQSQHLTHNFKLSQLNNKTNNSLGNYKNDKYKAVKSLNCDLLSLYKTNKFEKIPIDNFIEAIGENENENYNINDFPADKNSSLNIKHKNNLPLLSPLSEAKDRKNNNSNESLFVSDTDKQMGFFSPQKLNTKKDFTIKASNSNDKNIIYEKRNMAFNKKQLEKLNIKVNNMNINYGKSTNSTNIDYNTIFNKPKFYLDDNNNNYFSNINYKKNSLQNFDFNCNTSTSNEKTNNYRNKDKTSDLNEISKAKYDFINAKNLIINNNGLKILNGDKANETYLCESKFANSIAISPEKNNNLNKISYNKSDKLLKNHYESYINSENKNDKNDKNNKNEKINNDFQKANKYQLGNIFHKNSNSLIATKDHLLGNELINLNENFISPRKLISDKTFNLKTTIFDNNYNNNNKSNFKLPQIN